MEGTWAFPFLWFQMKFTFYILHFSQKTPSFTRAIQIETILGSAFHIPFHISHLTFHISQQLKARGSQLAAKSRISFQKADH